MLQVLEMVELPKGGRGKKAPYTTKVIRVPEPLVDHINELVQRYLEQGSTAYVDSFPSKQQAIEYSELVLKQKKGARESMRKLLQLLYGED